MSRAAPYGVGGWYGARGSANTVGRILLDVGGNDPTNYLTVEGLPRLSVWAQQVAPLGVGQGGTILLEGMVRPFTVGDDTSDNWITIAGPVTLVPGVAAVVINIEFPVSKIRLRAVPAAGLTLDVNYILSGNA